MTNSPGSTTGLRVAGSLTMADVKAFERKAADWERRVTKDRQSARAALVRMGIITRHGRLAKRYSN